MTTSPSSSRQPDDSHQCGQFLLEQLEQVFSLLQEALRERVDSSHAQAETQAVPMEVQATLLRQLEEIHGELDQLAEERLKSLARFLDASDWQSPPSVRLERHRSLSVGFSDDASHLRFQKRRFHARGGLGEVHEGVDQQLQRVVAIKEIRRDRRLEASAAARFLNEARITARLEHPGIVPVYGLGTNKDGRPYYAMRFVHGLELRNAIDAYHNTNWQGKKAARELELRRLISRFLDVCDAVAFAHDRGIVHRDLKPNNVLLGKDGETFLVDWGVAKQLSTGMAGNDGAESVVVDDNATPEEHETATGELVGTPAYMSPEQAAGNWSEVNPQSDIFSLGATLSVLLTNRAAIPGESVAEVLENARLGRFTRPRMADSSVPRPLDAICAKAMAHSAADRYASVRDLANDIERYLADQPVSAFREPLQTRLARVGRKHRAWVQVGMAATVLVALVSVISVFAIQHSWRDKLAAEQRASQRAEEAAAANAEADADHRLAVLERARRAMQLGQWNEAESSLAAELSQDAGGAERLLLERVRCQMVMNRTKDARDNLQHILALPSVDPEITAAAQLLLGDLVLAEDEATGLQYIAKAVGSGKLGPADRVFADGIQAGSWTDAIDCFERALRLQPWHPRANHMLFVAYVATGRREEAKSVLKRAEMFFPDDPSFNVAHALIAAFQGDAKEVDRLMREVRRTRVFVDKDLDLLDSLLRLAAEQVARPWDERLRPNELFDALVPIGQYLIRGRVPSWEQITARSSQSPVSIPRHWFKTYRKLATDATSGLVLLNFSRTIRAFETAAQDPMTDGLVCLCLGKFKRSTDRDGFRYWTLQALQRPSIVDLQPWALADLMQECMERYNSSGEAFRRDSLRAEWESLAAQLLDYRRRVDAQIWSSALFQRRQLSADLKIAVAMNRRARSEHPQVADWIDDSIDIHLSMNDFGSTLEALDEGRQAGVVDEARYERALGILRDRVQQFLSTKLKPDGTEAKAGVPGPSLPGI